MTSLLAMNLPRSVGDETLKQLFGRFGRVERVVFVFDRSVEGLRRFAFIDMASREAALRAMESLDQQLIDGTPLHVEAYQPSYPSAVAAPKTADRGASEPGWTLIPQRRAAAG